MYRPTAEAKLYHRHTVVDGVHVGIGGDITSSKGEIIPEASQDQYEKIYERGGHDHLVEKVSSSKPKNPKKDSGSKDTLSQEDE